MEVVRLKPYLRAMRAMGFGEADMRRVEAMILAAPAAHPLVKGLRGVRKARFARPSRGKSGGGRTLYYVMVSRNLLFMLTAYPKSERDDLSPEQRKAILRAIESIKG
jgi:hypothetical protein